MEEIQDKPTHQMSNEQLNSIINGEEPGTTEEAVEAKVTETEETQELQEETAEPAETEPEVPEKAEVEETGELTLLRKQIENQEKFLARMGTELGLLRKKNPEEEVERLQQLRDLQFEDPIAFQEEYAKYKAEKEEAQNREAQETMQQNVENNKQNVRHIVPDFDNYIPEIAEILLKDGYKTDEVETFKKNPYLTNSDFLFTLQKRAATQKENNALRTELDELKAKYGELEKKPEALLEKIENASRRPVTGKTGGARATDTLSNAPVHRLSIDEVRKIAHGG